MILFDFLKNLSSRFFSASRCVRIVLFFVAMFCFGENAWSEDITVDTTKTASELTAGGTYTIKDNATLTINLNGQTVSLAQINVGAGGTAGNLIVNGPGTLNVNVIDPDERIINRIEINKYAKINVTGLFWADAKVANAVTVVTGDRTGSINIKEIRNNEGLGGVFFDSNGVAFEGSVDNLVKYSIENIKSSSTVIGCDVKRTFTGNAKKETIYYSVNFSNSLNYQNSVESSVEFSANETSKPIKLDFAHGDFTNTGDSAILTVKAPDKQTVIATVSYYFQLPVWNGNSTEGLQCSNWGLDPDKTENGLKFLFENYPIHINSGLANYPEFSDDVKFKDLSVGNGASVTVSGGNFTVNHLEVSGSGSFNTTGGTVTVSESGNSSISNLNLGSSMTVSGGNVSVSSLKTNNNCSIDISSGASVSVTNTYLGSGCSGKLSWKGIGTLNIPKSGANVDYGTPIPSYAENLNVMSIGEATYYQANSLTGDGNLTLTRATSSGNSDVKYKFNFDTNISGNTVSINRTVFNSSSTIDEDFFSVHKGNTSQSFTVSGLENIGIGEYFNLTVYSPDGKFTLGGISYEKISGDGIFWTGNVSSDWSNRENWSGLDSNQQPDLLSEKTVIIDKTKLTGGKNPPNINNTAEVGSIIIRNNMHVTMHVGSTFTVKEIKCFDTSYFNASYGTVKFLDGGSFSAVNPDESYFNNIELAGNFTAKSKMKVNKDFIAENLGGKKIFLEDNVIVDGELYLSGSSKSSMLTIEGNSKYFKIKNTQNYGMYLSVANDLKIGENGGNSSIVYKAYYCDKNSLATEKPLGWVLSFDGPDEFIWTGKGNDKRWKSIANWSPRGVPEENSSVYIPGGMGENYPLLESGDTVSVKKLKIGDENDSTDAFAKLFLNGQGFTVSGTDAGSFTNYGKIFTNGNGLNSIILPSSENSVKENGVWSYSAGNVQEIKNLSYNKIEITGKVSVAGEISANSVFVGSLDKDTEILCSADTKINAPVTLNGAAVFNNGFYTVEFANTIDGAYAFSSSGSGKVIFGGAVGGSESLSSVSFGGNVDLKANVTTRGKQLYSGAVNVCGDIKLLAGTAIAAGEVEFSSTIDDSKDKTHSLTIGSFASSFGGNEAINTNAIFGGAVGKKHPLKKLSVFCIAKGVASGGSSGSSKKISIAAEESEFLKFEDNAKLVLDGNVGISGDNTFESAEINGNAKIYGKNKFKSFLLKGNAYFYDANTFDSVLIDNSEIAGETKVRFARGKTQNFTQSWTNKNGSVVSFKGKSADRRLVLDLIDDEADGAGDDADAKWIANFTNVPKNENFEFVTVKNSSAQKKDYANSLLIKQYETKIKDGGNTKNWFLTQTTFYWTGKSSGSWKAAENWATSEDGSVSASDYPDYQGYIDSIKFASNVTNDLELGSDFADSFDILKIESLEVPEGKRIGISGCKIESEKGMIIDGTAAVFGSQDVSAGEEPVLSVKNGSVNWGENSCIEYYGSNDGFDVLFVESESASGTGFVTQKYKSLSLKKTSGTKVTFKNAVSAVAILQTDDGNAIFEKAVKVSGGVEFNGSNEFKGTLECGGAAIFAGTNKFSGDVVCTGDGIFSGTSNTFEGNLTVGGGAAIFAGINKFSGNVVCEGNGTFSGTSNTFAGTLTCGGKITFTAGTSEFCKKISANGDITIEADGVISVVAANNSAGNENSSAANSNNSALSAGFELSAANIQIAGKLDCSAVSTAVAISVPNGNLLISGNGIFNAASGASASTEISGAVTLSDSGSFNASAGTTKVCGKMDFSAGNFMANSGTFVLGGSDGGDANAVQSFTAKTDGSTAFCNLTVESGAQVLSKNGFSVSGDFLCNGKFSSESESSAISVGGNLEAKKSFVSASEISVSGNLINHEESSFSAVEKISVGGNIENSGNFSTKSNVSITGDFSNDGTFGLAENSSGLEIRISGNLNNGTSGKFSALNGSTVEFNGAVSQAVKNNNETTGAGSFNFGTFKISNSSADGVTFAGKSKIESVLITSGSKFIAAENSEINLVSKWANEGDFAAEENSVVNLTGATVSLNNNGKSFWKVQCELENQTILINGTNKFNSLESSGENSKITFADENKFENLSVTGAGTSVKFAAGKTQKITGSLTITGGTESADRKILLQSSAGGTQWMLDFADSASVSVEYADISDSCIASAARQNAFFCVDSGNNEKWNFPGAKYLWTGGAATSKSNWFEKLNWETESGAHSVPGQFTEITIPTEKSNYPVLTSEINLGKTISVPNTNGKTLESSLLIEESAEIDFAGFGVTVNKLENRGTVRLMGKADFNGHSIINTESSLVEYYGDEISRFCMGTEYSNLILNGNIVLGESVSLHATKTDLLGGNLSGKGVLTLNSPLTVNPGNGNPVSSTLSIAVNGDAVFLSGNAMLKNNFAVKNAFFKGCKTTVSGSFSAENIICYAGDLSVSGTVSASKDFIVLGANYSADDNSPDASASGFAGLLSYKTAREAAPNFVDEFEDAPYSAKVTVDGGKTISVGKNFYANGTSLLGSSGSTSKWNLKVGSNLSAQERFLEAYNCEISNSKVICDDDSEDGTKAQVAAENCTDSGENENWDFYGAQIESAYTVFDNVIFVRFNKPLRNSNGELSKAIEKSFVTLKSDGVSVPYVSAYTDSECTTLISASSVQEFYLKSSVSWNTDATGESSGDSESTDRNGVHKNSIPLVDIPSSVSEKLHIITDRFGRRIKNYGSATSGAAFTLVEDKASPVLIAVRTGQENHVDSSLGIDSQMPFDGHNFIEFQYSESVNIGSFVLDDQTAENNLNVRATESLGEIKSTEKSGLLFSGLATIQNGSLETGSGGSASTTVHALYRNFAATLKESSEGAFPYRTHRIRESIAGFVDGTVEIEGKKYNHWLGYIDEGELPSGTVSAVENASLTDKNGNPIDFSGTQNHPLSAVEVSSEELELYGKWDLSAPVFAVYNSTVNVGAAYQNSFEIAGSCDEGEHVLNRIEFHVWDNNPNEVSDFSGTEWFTQIGWCDRSVPSSLHKEYSYAPDFVGGARSFDSSERKSSGGLRYSSIYNKASFFKYSLGVEVGKGLSDFDGEKIIRSGKYVRNSVFFPLDYDYTKTENYKALKNTDDNLYFGVYFKNGTKLPLKQTFSVSYDGKAFATDLAGNRMKSADIRTIDSLTPKFCLSLSKVNGDEMVFVINKELNVSDLTVIPNEYPSVPSEKFNALEKMLESLRIIKISPEGNYEQSSDLQIDYGIPAKVAFRTDRFTGIKIKLNRKISFEDMQKYFLQVYSPFTSRDPSTGIPETDVTFVQDISGNFMSSGDAAPLSDFAIGVVNPVYAYDNRQQNEDGSSYTYNMYSESSPAVHDWNANQKNYGTLLSGYDIYLNAVLEGFESAESFPASLAIYLDSNPKSESVSAEFNEDIATHSSLENWRVWLPEKSINGEASLVNKFVSEHNNSSSTMISYSKTCDEKKADSFTFKLNATDMFGNDSAASGAGWKAGDQISFLFGLFDGDGKSVKIYHAPQFIEGDESGSYAMYEYPLYSLRLKNESDLTSLDLWSFRLKDIKNQRGGVTILNNVINASEGESATVKVQMESEGSLNVCVMTLDGNIVQYLQKGTVSKGDHFYSWNGRTKSGKTVARGLYFVRVFGSGFDETRKIMVVKD